MRYIPILLAVGLTACGTNMEERAATGGLTGLGIGALAGGPVGAIIGTAVGGLAGAATPVPADTAFRYGVKELKSATSGILPKEMATTPVATGTASAPVMRINPDTIKQAQTTLRDQGYYNGPIDGLVGPKTRTALRNYQRKNNMTATGNLDDITLNHLIGSPPVNNGASAPPPPPPNPDVQPQ